MFPRAEDEPPFERGCGGRPIFAGYDASRAVFMRYEQLLNGNIRGAGRQCTAIFGYTIWPSTLRFRRLWKGVQGPVCSLQESEGGYDEDEDDAPTEKPDDRRDGDYDQPFTPFTYPDAR